MPLFKRLNIILGWIIFFIAFAVYALTAEETSSLWDCGEFISGAYKLEVVHPPGAPLFLMLGRIFSLLAMGDITQVAFMINLMSGLSTAFAVLFLFWSSTSLMGRIAFKDNDYSPINQCIVLASSTIAALSTTFLDTLWFSAVEGEVYALSIFFMALVLWASIRWWESDRPYADRWLILISFSLGLSIGVHLLSLLVLPIVGFIYYIKKYTFSIRGFILAMVVSFVGIGFLLKGIIVGLPSIAGQFDILFVNSFGLPFNSGIITFFVLLTLALVTSIYLTQRKKMVELNKLILALTFVIIGYTSYLMVPIRAAANPPINMNKPSDIFSLISYLNREQYGSRPLLMGPSYTASRYDITDFAKKGKRWAKGKDKYIVIGDKTDYKFKKGSTMLFPRTGFWQENRHKQAFRAWLNPSSYHISEIDLSSRERKERVIKTFEGKNAAALARNYANQKNTSGARGKHYIVRDDFSFLDNIRFFIRYQFGFMYLRYFMWNFVGRQNDMQGTYYNNDGRWESGIPFIDNFFRFVGLKDSYPAISKTSQKDKNNFAHNHFYYLPLLLGLLGLYFHFKNHRLGFGVVALLFLITSLLQIIYHNQPPIEPRERDYVLVGSFYAFTIWIGFGVYALYTFLSKKIAQMPSLVSSVLIGAVIPALMGFQGWNDHDRSGRSTTLDFAINFLESCAPNAILFTQGDNDTYPLWYAQEVEGIRPDVRVVNTSLLGVDWYIDQLRYAVNEAPALTLQISQDKVEHDKRNVINYHKRPHIDPNTYYSLKKIVQIMGSDESKYKVPIGRGTRENYLPTKKVLVPVDTLKFKTGDIIPANKKEKIVPALEIDLTTGRIMKNHLILLDVVASNFNKLPIYFNSTFYPSSLIGLEKYIQREGLGYRLVPLLNPSKDTETAQIHTNKLYDNIKQKFKWGNMSDSTVLLDENTVRLARSMKVALIKLAENLVNNKDTLRAEEILDLYSLQMQHTPIEYIDISIPQMYFALGKKEKGEKTLRRIGEYTSNELTYLNGISSESEGAVNPYDIQTSMRLLQSLTQVSKQYMPESPYTKELTEKMQAYLKQSI